MTLFVASLVLLGACVGFLAGLLGIGGGMILTPFITLLLPLVGIHNSVIVHVAIATSLATILFTSLSSMSAHNKKGAVIWSIVVSVAPGILLGGLVGAKISSLLSTFWLSLIFALFVSTSAIKMFFNAKPRPSRSLPGFFGKALAGCVIGLISSILGAGGAFISVPMMVYCNVKMHQAVGTSAAIGFPIALAGTIGYVLSGLGVTNLPAWPLAAGYVYLPALFACAAGSVFFAPLGAKVAHSIDTKPLKKLFACNLSLIAIYMLYKAFSSL